MKILSLATAAALATSPSLTAQVTRTVRGDTTIILTKGNGIWGPPKAAVEVARIGGGPSKETMLGKPEIITALPNGGVVFYDRKALDAPVVRMFDANGRFVRNIGRIGSGPGEYRELSIDIKATADGHIWIADIGNARLNIYAPDGSYQSSVAIPGNSWSLNMLQVGNDGTIYLATYLRKPGETGMAGLGAAYLSIDPKGRITDTLKASAGAFSTLAMLSTGRILSPAPNYTGVSFGPTAGSKQVIIAALDLPRERYTDADRAENSAMQKRMETTVAARGMSFTPGPGLPEFKPTFDWVRATPENRVWIRRNGPSMPPDSPAAPIAYDAFDAQGTFLGEVHLPRFAPSSRLSFAGDYVWAVVGKYGEEEFVVKYKVR